MISIDPARLNEPADFDAKCRQKGLQWLAAHPKAARKGNKRPKAFWSAFKPQLSDAFCELCAYGAMYEPVGTVDHFIPVDADETRAYDWDNYRFASAWINSSKQKAVTVLDPLLVQNGWFEVLLPSLQLVVTDQVPNHLRALAEETLNRLHLRDDERVLRQRRRWYRLFREGKLDLNGLRENAPLIAAAIDKQNAAAVQP
ncbi:MAG: hypothetical protein Q8K01_01985 [Sulfurimicrobium sp.]|nr:hypothetical protein [Sulfurimicrobium sp.]MDP3688449.1 hypothetical protein [Sulfurimicrobium sp.]